MWFFQMFACSSWVLCKRLQVPSGIFWREKQACRRLCWYDVWLYAWMVFSIGTEYAMKQKSHCWCYVPSCKKKWSVIISESSFSFTGKRVYINAEKVSKVCKVNPCDYSRCLLDFTGKRCVVGTRCQAVYYNPDGQPQKCTGIGRNINFDQFCVKR